ncbi:unnamed protein product [Discula destructiva]
MSILEHAAPSSRRKGATGGGEANSSRGTTSMRLEHRHHAGQKGAQHTSLSAKARDHGVRGSRRRGASSRRRRRGGGASFGGAAARRGGGGAGGFGRGLGGRGVGSGTGTGGREGWERCGGPGGLRGGGGRVVDAQLGAGGLGLGEACGVAVGEEAAHGCIGDGALVGAGALLRVSVYCFAEVVRRSVMMIVCEISAAGSEV